MVKGRRALQEARQAHSQLMAWMIQHNKGVWGAVSPAICRCLSRDRFKLFRRCKSGWRPCALPQPSLNVTSLWLQVGISLIARSLGQEAALG